VHGILQSHNGAITVYSRPGQGTVFHLYFPVARRAESHATEFRRKLPPCGKGEQVLFIDDEEPIRRMADKMLRKLGYTVTACGSGESALAEFRNRSGGLAVVMTDMTMPGMSGLDVVAGVREIRPDIPVILTSGFLGESDLARARALNVTRMLDKPLSAESLAAAMRACLEPA
jgi:CheY-like chemotaxis protein